MKKYTLLPGQLELLKTLPISPELYGIVDDKLIIYDRYKILSEIDDLVLGTGMDIDCCLTKYGHALQNLYDQIAFYN